MPPATSTPIADASRLPGPGWLERVRRRLRNTPVRRKLEIVVMVTCTASLALAGVALFAFQIYVQRQVFVRDTMTLSEMVAANLSGALAFDDRLAAADVLASLRARPEIESAVVRRTTGEIFASAGLATELDDTTRWRDGAHWIGWELQVVVPLRVEGELFGELCLCSNYESRFKAALWIFLTAISIIAIAVLCIALLVGSILQGFILRPIDRLLTATRLIAADNNYSVRAVKIGDDEVGVLTDAFNQMLDRLHEGDQALRSANTELAGEIAQRHRLERELLDSSRRAGMAEVATGVLHNVGNVLNSVNVSATLLTDQIRRSHLGQLIRAKELLMQQGERRGRFLTEDERGRHWPDFVLRVADELAKEHTGWKTELEALARHVEHIKEIVAMQQSYARVAGMVEKLDAAGLVEDAVRIQKMALMRAAVTVTRDFRLVPLVVVDKHKVLQILVNVIANAKQAVEAQNPPRREIRLSIHQGAPGRVFVVVEDNGVGIPADNLIRIFSHGFTTKPDGHGFGLHSGALAAREMGGSLRAASAGLGRGATFTLELPADIADTV